MADYSIPLCHAPAPPKSTTGNAAAVLAIAAVSVAVGVVGGLALSSAQSTTTLYAPAVATSTRSGFVTTAPVVNRPHLQAFHSVQAEELDADVFGSEEAVFEQTTTVSQPSGVQALGWSSIAAGLVMMAAALYRMVARPTPRYSAGHDHFVSAAFWDQKTTKTEMREWEGEQVETMKGMRWDAANLRWVKDANAVVPIMYKPETGAAYTLWPVVHTRLVDYNLKSIPPKEAQKMMRTGAKLVDIRVAKSWTKSRAAGSISVPLFRPVAGDAMMDTVKKISMAALAMEATERNTDFLKDAEAAGLKKWDRIIVGCTLGGTLDTMIRTSKTKPAYADVTRSFGRESRSLKGCYELIQAGYKNVWHLEGGLNEWFYQGLPTEQDD